MRFIKILIVLFAVITTATAQQWRSVDPRIGSVGVGRTFPGPSMPFGMVKPGPDCGDGLSTSHPNAGWAPMPAPVLGFSQTHVSGTGGGQKYGNILIQPFLSSHAGDADSGSVGPFADRPQRRTAETVELGYYATTYENGIRTEITTAGRCAYYRLHYPHTALRPTLLIDATHFLGKDTVPDLRERQQFVDAALLVNGTTEVTGSSTVRGGWNNGDAYTVFFCLQTDKPFQTSASSSLRGKAARTALLFSDTLVSVRIGISYVSCEQARRNIGTCTFQEQLSALRQAWQQQLGKVSISGTPEQRRMFYTALYHTMLMPVDKTGENPRWTGGSYYDDYYAIWDTYRTSSPLLTLLCPDRQAGIINSLLAIYEHDGYLPDARSGDCNGRTQGGSNAEVVIADAWAKGLGRLAAATPAAAPATVPTAAVPDASASVPTPAIDYPLALRAMIHDAEADPGADHEKHGRGGISQYKRLGYIPYGIPRAGTRTVEYAFNDWCLAQVAAGLGHDSLCLKYMRRSRNWRNLWRSDYLWDDVRGYIMPRDASGVWLDSVPWGHSQVFHPRIPYTPVTKVAPWYLPWWDTFFYEALSAEYSLSVPHDVPGLIEACGGPEAFRRRLDLFFERGRYNVGNEPSFLTPCLYHWIGRPDLSSRRIRQIISDNYSDAPDGLPGNDDSGAMSSWLAFHMMGLYPNAGHDYYLLNLPLLPEYTFTLSNGRTLHVSRKGEGDSFGSVLFNGQELTDARITHSKLMEGGELVFRPTPERPTPGPSLKREGSSQTQGQAQGNELSTPLPIGGGAGGGSVGSVSFTLNRQFRTWPLQFLWQGDTLLVQCKQTQYRIARSEAEHATGFCWLTPQQDGTIYNNVRETFLFVSADAMRHLRQYGWFTYDGITWRSTDGGNGGDAAHVQADVDGTELTIALHEPTGLYLVEQMRGNPLGIDWQLHFPAP